MSDRVDALQNMLEAERAKPHRRRSKTAVIALWLVVVPWATYALGMLAETLYGQPVARAICWYPEFNFLKVIGIVYVGASVLAILWGIFSIGWVRLNKDRIFGIGYGFMSVVSGFVSIQLPSESIKCILRIDKLFVNW